jgi:hypothetical protein
MRISERSEARAGDHAVFSAMGDLSPRRERATQRALSAVRTLQWLMVLALALAVLPLTLWAATRLARLVEWLG